MAAAERQKRWLPESGHQSDLTDTVIDRIERSTNQSVARHANSMKRCSRRNGFRFESYGTRERVGASRPSRRQ